MKTVLWRKSASKKFLAKKIVSQWRKTFTIDEEKEKSVWYQPKNNPNYLSQSKVNSWNNLERHDNKLQQEELPPV